MIPQFLLNVCDLLLGPLCSLVAALRVRFQGRLAAKNVNCIFRVLDFLGNACLTSLMIVHLLPLAWWQVVDQDDTFCSLVASVNVAWWHVGMLILGDTFCFVLCERLFKAKHFFDIVGCNITSFLTWPIVVFRIRKIPQFQIFLHTSFLLMSSNLFSESLKVILESASCLSRLSMVSSLDDT